MSFKLHTSLFAMTLIAALGSQAAISNQNSFDYVCFLKSGSPESSSVLGKVSGTYEDLKKSGKVSLVAQEDGEGVSKGLAVSISVGLDLSITISAAQENGKFIATARGVPFVRPADGKSYEILNTVESHINTELHFFNPESNAPITVTCKI